MDLYVIVSRNRFTTAEDLEEEGSAVRWIRSCVLAESTVCIYEAESPEAIRAHARTAGLLVDEITPLADAMRPDPMPVAA